MKRSILFLLSILLLFNLSIYSNEKFMISFSGNLLSPSDSNFKDIYGSSIFYPELNIGYKVYKNFYLWAGYSFLTKNGTTPVLKLETKSTQNYISFGAGYNGNFSNKFGYRVKLGVFNVNYKEEAMEEEVKNSAIGFRIDVGIIFNINKNIFTDINIGYLYASDTIEEESIKLGGLKTGIGVGFRF